MVNSNRRKRFSVFTLISLNLHLLMINIFVFVLHDPRTQIAEDLISVEMIDQKLFPKLRRKQPKPPMQDRKLLTPRQEKSDTQFRPKTIRLRATDNPINESIRPDADPLLHNATLDQTEPKENLPDLTTDTKQIENINSQIGKITSVQLPIDSGEGIKSSRQRVKSDGSGGLRNLESKGTDDIGEIGDGSGKIGSGGDGNIIGDNPFAKALIRIGKQITETRILDQIDVVFLIDTSASMQDNIQMVAKNLFAMTDTFDRELIDYHLGMVEFSVRWHGENIKTKRLASDPTILQKEMQKILLSGDEHALDALMHATYFVEFRPNSEKFAILVTDEPTTTKLQNETATMRDRVLADYRRDRISVNVIGFPGKFQKELAESTGGIWEKMPGLFQKTRLVADSRSDHGVVSIFRKVAWEIRRKSRLTFSVELELDPKIENENLEKKIFDLVSETIRKRGIWITQSATLEKIKRDEWRFQDRDKLYTVRKIGDQIKIYDASPETKNRDALVDLIIMLDYSRSMGGKADAISKGFRELFSKLDLLPIDYDLGMIRFAEPTDVIIGIDGVSVTQMPLSESEIDRLMEAPFGGDEHLIDAIVEGLPRIEFRPNATRFILILTDEPTTGTYPPDRAIEVCRSLDLKACVIGVSLDGRDFQFDLASQTQGAFFDLPKSLEISDINR